MRGCKLMTKAYRAGVAQADVRALAEDIVEAVERCAGVSDAEAALGDLLMLVCALARAAQVDPELALNEALDRFVERFAALEQKLAAQGSAMPVDQADSAKYWDCVKLHKN